MPPAFLQVLPTSAGNLRGLSHEIMAQIGPGHDDLDGITSVTAPERGKALSQSIYVKL